MKRRNNGHVHPCTQQQETVSPEAKPGGLLLFRGRRGESNRIELIAPEAIKIRGASSPHTHKTAQNTTRRGMQLDAEV